MTNLDPFNAPTSQASTVQPAPTPEQFDYWRAMAKRNEKRARRSHHLLVKMRTEIDGLLEADQPPRMEAS